uniref:Glycosyltransferase RgtA/B/C/D-like domain-containing protein n=2 Tax=Chryseobacterium TaxID=59732 RepID=A0AAU6WRN5_9FLAO
MPWHTIDGIFFATFSIFFTHRKYYFSAIILAFFAALTKQSFYIYFIFSGLLNLILILKYKRNIRLFDIIISSILLLISFAIILQEEVIYSFQYFLKQTKTENGLKDF